MTIGYVRSIYVEGTGSLMLTYSKLSLMSRWPQETRRFDMWLPQNNSLVICVFFSRPVSDPFVPLNVPTDPGM